MNKADQFDKEFSANLGDYLLSCVVEIDKQQGTCPEDTISNYDLQWKENVKRFHQKNKTETLDMDAFRKEMDKYFNHVHVLEKRTGKVYNISLILSY